MSGLEHIINGGDKKYSMLAKMIADAKVEVENKKMSVEEYEMILKDVATAVAVKSESDDMKLKGDFLKVLDAMSKFL